MKGHSYSLIQELLDAGFVCNIGPNHRNSDPKRAWAAYLKRVCHRGVLAKVTGPDADHVVEKVYRHYKRRLSEGSL